jgi:hypothetical protein
MAAATSVTSNITALGPIKVEFVTCTMAATGDTYTSRLVRPLAAIVQVNATSTANPVYALSGQTFTITEANISSSTVNLIIYGF